MKHKYLTAHLGKAHAILPLIQQPLMEGLTDAGVTGGGTTGGNAGGADQHSTGQTLTFTQAQLDAIITDRLARAKASWEREAKEKSDREKLGMEERLKKDLDEAIQKVADAEKRARAAEWKAELAGKVVSTTAALKLVDADKHVKQDGTLDVEAVLKEYPFLAAQQAAAGTDSQQPAGGQDRSSQNEQQPARDTQQQQPSGPAAGGTHAGARKAPGSWAEAREADKRRR